MRHGNFRKEPIQQIPFLHEMEVAGPNESCARPDRPVEDKRLHPRDRCIHEGYHSVALIPLRAGDRIIGILQLNDRRPNQFTVEMISFFGRYGRTHWYCSCPQTSRG